MRKLLIAVACLIIFNNGNAFAAFIISGESACCGSGVVYSYKFSEYASFPDSTVKISEYASFSDITMKLVDDSRQADLIFADGIENAEMKICKSNSSFGVKTIKVSKYAPFPDLTVKLSKYSSFSDYKIFIASKIFTIEEVAALFAVILKTNKK